jgi:signal transduction histidine kinase
MEFAARQQLKIEFVHNKIPRGVSYEVSLCLFRIMQEALSNAAKHSTAKHFEVKLRCSANELQLIVSDHGTGFSAKAAMNKGSLGLISMRERAKMANGTILIRSNRRHGTTIDVRVPIGLQHAFQQAAG